MNIRRAVPEAFSPSKTCHPLLEKERRGRLRNPVVVAVAALLDLLLWFSGSQTHLADKIGARFSPKWREINSDFASRMWFGYTSSFRSAERIKINR
jgi:hypothetical protein